MGRKIDYSDGTVEALTTLYRRGWSMEQINRQHHYCEGIGNWFGCEDEWSDNGFCYKGERWDDAEKTD